MINLLQILLLFILSLGKKTMGVLIKIGKTLTLCGCIAMITPSLGQELSPEQQEVWQFIENCQDAIAAEDDQAFDCFHDEFIGWFYPDLLPRTAEAQREFMAIQFDTTEIPAAHVTPIAVQVYGDFAIAHYFVRYVIRSQDGTDTEARDRFTDVLIKENGNWKWISDHGGPISIIPN
tara:strand:+ start:180 stop:710 length:531 start_codon:yes stop_codon:yes gene_type:complete